MTNADPGQKLWFHTGMNYAEIAHAFDKYIYDAFRTPFGKYETWHGNPDQSFWMTSGIASHLTYDGKTLYSKYGYIIAFPIKMEEFQLLINGELMEDDLNPYWDWESDPENAVLWIYEMCAARSYRNRTYKLVEDGDSFSVSLYLKFIRMLKTRLKNSCFKYVAGWAVAKSALDMAMHHSFSAKYLPALKLGGKAAEDYNPVTSHIVYIDIKESRFFSSHIMKKPLLETPRQKARGKKTKLEMKSIHATYFKERKYKIFISYANVDHSDEELADEWKKSLELKFNNDVEVFLAPRSIAPGDDWERVIKQSLWESNAVVLLLDEKTLESPWVQKELICAAWLFHQTIFPILMCSIERITTNEKTHYIYQLISKYQMINGRIPHANSTLGNSIANYINNFRGEGRPCPIYHGSQCPSTLL